MAYFEREQVEAIGVGVISMRRSSDRRSGFRADDAPEKIFGPIGDDIQRAFEAFNFLEMVRDDRELLNARLRIDPHVRLRQELATSDEGWQSTGAQLCRTRGLGYTSEVDATMANLLQHCNGTRTVGELLEEMASRRNVSSQSLASEYLAVLRPLIARGLLLPQAAN